MPSTSHTKKVTGRLAVIGVVAACALACSLPLLAGAGVLASIAAATSGAPWLAVALTAVAGAAAAAWWVRRRRPAPAAPGCAGGCGC